jgi:hypothetical protein
LRLAAHVGNIEPVSRREKVMSAMKILALLVLLATISAMAAACSTVVPPGYSGASEQRVADQIEWEDDPWR